MSAQFTPSPEMRRAVEQALIDQRGGRWKQVQGTAQVEFKCFEHDDQRASAHFHPKKMVWVCRTCGDVGGGLKDLCRRLGVEDGGSGQVERRAPAGRKPERQYLYVFKGVTYTKSRYEYPDQLTDEGKPRKDFIWSPRFPEGVTVGNMPLHWREDPKARPDDRVVFVEGEKVVEALWQRQVLACCGAWGASQRDFGKALEELKGREVWLAPDNDPPGRDYMDAIASGLRKIGIKPRWVRVPLGPKGDLADYFAEGGDLDALWKGDLQEPLTEYTGEGVRIRLPCSLGQLVFDANDITRTQRALDARVYVWFDAPGFEPRAFTTRMNLLSASARRDAKTELVAFHREAGKDFPWSELLNTAVTLVDEAFQRVDPATDVFDVDDSTHDPLLLGELLTKGQPTLIFGDSGSLKTYLAMLMGISIAVGWEFPGEGAPLEIGNVLYLDFEDVTAPTFKRRLRRLHDGIGLEIVPGMFHYWPGRGIPLVNQVDAIREKVRKDNIRLLIVDSAAPACDGPAENSDVAARYFGALTRIGISSITIAHVNNEEDVTRPFGSRFWKHLSRRCWYIAKAGFGDEYETGLYSRKVNEGREPDSRAYRWTFDGREGPVTFDLASFRKVDKALNKLRPADARLREALLSGPATVRAIADTCGLSTWEAARAALKRHEAQFVWLTGEGQDAMWAIRAREAV